MKRTASLMDSESDDGSEKSHSRNIEDLLPPDISESEEEEEEGEEETPLPVTRTRTEQEKDVPAFSCDRLVDAVVREVGTRNKSLLEVESLQTSIMLLVHFAAILAQKSRLSTAPRNKSIWVLPVNGYDSDLVGVVAECLATFSEESVKKIHPSSFTRRDPPNEQMEDCLHKMMRILVDTGTTFNKQNIELFKKLQTALEERPVSQSDYSKEALEDTRRMIGGIIAKSKDKQKQKEKD